MTRPLRLLLLCAALCGIAVLSATPASAAGIYKYDVSIDDGANIPVPGGYVYVGHLDATKDTRMIISPPSGPNRYDATQALGSSSISTASNVANLSVGDTITIRQPAASVAPTETYVIPSPAINLTVGARALTGSIPAGLTGSIEGDYRCDLRSNAYTLASGPFNVPYTKIVPGEIVRISAFSPSGDSTRLAQHSPGESPCVTVYAAPQTAVPVGAPPNPTPYYVTVTHLIESLVAPASVRVVVHRGSTVLVDQSANSSYVQQTFGTKPLPGDVVDVYRPKTAPAPTYSIRIPNVSSVYDPSVDLLAIDGPAAGLLRVTPCRTYSCSTGNYRAQRDTPAGRNLFDFGHPSADFGPLDLRADDMDVAEYIDPDFTIDYLFQSTPGDLVAPKQSFKLAGKFKVAAMLKLLKKGLKIKLHSSEAASAKLTLTMGKTKLATVSGKAIAGTTTLKLKFTKSGKKAIKKFAKAGKHAKSRRAALSAVLTDASGNPSTLVKTTRIKP